MLKLSVIIPSHNRKASVLETLSALARQSLPTNRFEVIVALDATTDGSGEAIVERDWPYDIRVIASNGRGASSARNAGAALARADRLVFLDDDILVDPGFLEAHVSAEPDCVIIGQSAPMIEGKDWFSAGLRTWWENRFLDMSKPGYRFAYTDVMSGNLSLGRALFDRIGGFDATLKCREDYELGLRLLDANAHLSYAPNARGLHFDRSDLKRNLARARSEGIADVQIVRKHPDLFAQMMFRNLAAPYRSARVLRSVLFTFPGLGRFCQSALLRVVPWMEALGSRRSWLASTHMAWAHSYYSGAAAELGSPKHLEDFQSQTPPVDASKEWLDLDLVEDTHTLLDRYRLVRPKGVTVRFGDWKLAVLEPRFGTEPLSEVHVAGALRELAADCGTYTYVARALAPLPTADPVGFGEDVHRKEFSWSLGEVDVRTWHLTLRGRSAAYPLRLLVRCGSVPIGWTYLYHAPEPGTFWQTLRKHIVNDAALCRRLQREFLLASTAPPNEELPGISVVICTRDRTASLRRCLEAVQALDYPRFEIVVVDNAPSNSETADLVLGLPDVRYTREDRPGLDWARNCGLRESRYDLVAYTDDDTQADRSWLRGIAAAFSEPGVGAVTGLVLPMELDAEEQVYFEDCYGGMGKGFDPWVRDRTTMRDRDILWSSACGVGANMAFDRNLISQIGPFDPALDVGTATRGGGDIEMFHRVLASGAAFAYAPDAFVWHQHRSEAAALERQLADNGSGFAAYLLTAARKKTVARYKIFGFALNDWFYCWFVKRLIRPGRHHRKLVLAELKGMFRGYRGYRTALGIADTLMAADSRASERSRSE